MCGTGERRGIAGGGYRHVVYAGHARDCRDSTK